jgi:L-fuculose-phosphate aldolase
MNPEKKYRAERREVASFMRRLYKRSLTTTSGGNISLRISEDIILITPSSTDKGRMKWKEIGVMSIIGENLTLDLKLSMEFEMHLSIYRKMKDVQAVIHAHPVFASSFTALKSDIRTDLTAEAYAVLGEPLRVPYALMGTEELAKLVSESALSSGVLLLENHGVLTTGDSLLQAFDRIEVLENAAKMTLIAEITGKKSPLTRSRISDIKKLFG